jgi:transposase
MSMSSQRPCRRGRAQGISHGSHRPAGAQRWQAGLGSFEAVRLCEVGDLYAFVNRSGTQIKVLYFDRSGWCVWAKRLEAGRFIGDWSKVHTHEIDCTRLKLLLEGIEPRRQLKRYRHDPRPEDRRSDRCSPAIQGNSEHSHGVTARGCVA